MKRPFSKGEQHFQNKFGTKDKAENFYSKQMLNYLNNTMQSFISNQAMVFISTSNSEGECDCSFRKGPPGFIKVLNKENLIYPEYRGNGVWASLGNIKENHHIGMMFIDFFENRIGLHVNGKAKIIENKNLLQNEELLEILKHDSQETGSRKPECWVYVEIEEAYIHCSKHIPLLKQLDEEEKVDCSSNDESPKSSNFFKVKNQVETG